jgi:phosphopantothenoylcysteine decarboxylase/phosphopantothenate--cysteine ligase
VTEPFAGRKIALGVCGGIAAYKVAGLARELAQAGAEVSVVMTPSATNFVGPITFSTLTGQPVRIELFPEAAPTEIPHTDLGRTSDLVIIAPATAKTMAKFAQGISDDLMSALLLSARCPILMAPAMHTEMWLNEATQGNVAVLTGRGVRFIGPDSGPLAGPESGIGRLAEVPTIIEAAAEELALRAQLKDVRVLVTAGGTREAIDPMRFIGNASTGTMGFRLAQEAIRRGARVTLIAAPNHLIPPDGATVIPVISAADMREAVAVAAQSSEVLIMAAAVADWRPTRVSGAKIAKTEGPPDLELEPTVDILAEVGRGRSLGLLPGLKVLVGFCAETSDLKQAAASKLKAKKLDMVVGNLVGIAHSGPGAAGSEALILDRFGALDVVGLASKREIARRVMDKVSELLVPAQDENLGS